MLNLSRSIYSLFFAFALTSSPFSSANNLNQVQSYDLSGIAGTLNSMKADNVNTFLMIREELGLKQSYWIFDLRNGLKMDSIDKAIASDDILQAQWSEGLALFSATDSVVVVDPITMQHQSYKPTMPTGNVFMAWSKKNDRLVYQSEVLPKLESDNNADHQPHAVQTGLAISNDESFYVTSGFHDQSVRYWSLPAGGLQKTIELGGWFTSTNINSMALFSKGLVLATNSKSLKWLEHNAKKTKSSKKICDSQPSIHSFKATKSNIALYRCSQTGDYGLVKYQKQGSTITTVSLGQMATESNLNSVHLIKESLVLLIFDCGTIRLYDLTSKSLLTERTFANTLGLAYLENSNELVLLKTGKVLEVWKFQ